ncbi:hypothetical protein ACTA71_003119 [Dictyostelium dimigraforme]
MYFNFYVENASFPQFNYFFVIFKWEDFIKVSLLNSSGITSIKRGKKNSQTTVTRAMVSTGAILSTTETVNCIASNNRNSNNNNNKPTETIEATTLQFQLIPPNNN